MTTFSPNPTTKSTTHPSSDEADDRPAKQAKQAKPSIMIGCLQALIVANLVQVLAGFLAADPSPPADVLPGIAATALLGLAALPMVRAGERLGYKLGIGFCLASMVGMGPHKLFLENGAVIAPMALVGFALELLFISHAVRALRNN